MTLPLRVREALAACGSLGSFPGCPRFVSSDSGFYHQIPKPAGASCVYVVPSSAWPPSPIGRAHGFQTRDRGSKPRPRDAWSSDGGCRKYPIPFDPIGVISNIFCSDHLNYYYSYLIPHHMYILVVAKKITVIIINLTSAVHYS